MRIHTPSPSPQSSSQSSSQPSQAEQPAHVGQSRQPGVSGHCGLASAALYLIALLAACGAPGDGVADGPSGTSGDADGDGEGVGDGDGDGDGDGVGGDGDGDGDGEQVPPWVGDNPNAGSGHGDGDGAGAPNDDAADGGADADADDDADDEGSADAGDAISEADILHIDGDTLYALSRLSGLSIVDISEPDDLRILGRYRTAAMPFEMYVDDGRAFVMFSDFASWQWNADENDYQWTHNSRLLALDARDPADIVLEGEFELPGEVQDSRRIGDRLYLVTYQNGYCWNCDETPNTTITSLDISDREDVRQVDQLAFPGREGSYGGGKRSVTSTSERMYAAGVEYDWDSDGRSTIDVVDVSDPSGALSAGAQIEAAGSITSRWQMDEYEGVFRVVSQPNPWASDDSPVVETFAIDSTTEFVPLGRLEMSIPRNEWLRSVRFDGPRGYAITAEQMDPLFTLDLSDPASPQQVGELEMPGWVFHMQPRGERILALGFDPGHPDGAINVSLFDVSNSESPQMIERVHFGGDWASFAEDQNRIHKAFTVVDDLELMLVPHSGWEWDEGAADEDDAYGRYRSAVQLIDLSGDTLTLRGLADARGRARRAFMHGERMFSIGDEAVQSFDIGDRDAPEQLDALPIAVNAGASVRVNDYLVRISTGWWSNHQLLDVVPLSDAERADSLGQLSLRELFTDQGGVSEGEVWTKWWAAELFSVGDFVYLTVEREGEFAGGWGADKLIAGFDISDPSAPRHIETLRIALGQGYNQSGLGYLRLAGERPVVQAGTSLVIHHETRDWNASPPTRAARLEIIELSDNGRPHHVVSINRGEALTFGALRVAPEGEVQTWRMEAVDGDPTQVAFYLERLDLTGATPSLGEPINLPGAPVGYQDGEVITVGFRRERVDLASEPCRAHPKFLAFDWEEETCTLLHTPLRLLKIEDDLSATWVSELEISPDDRLSSVLQSGDLVFGQTGVRWGWDEGAVDDRVAGRVAADEQDLITVTGLGPTDLEIASRMEIPGTALAPLSRRDTGRRLVLGAPANVVVLDAEDPRAPAINRHPLYGYFCRQAEVSGNHVFCALGDRGLQVLPL